MTRLFNHRQDKIPGGLAEGKKPSDFDSKQLAKGMKVEMEHTTDKGMAQEIAMDHLTEDKDYYKKLEIMENGQGKEGYSYNRKIASTQKVGKVDLFPNNRRKGTIAVEVVKAVGEIYATEAMPEAQKLCRSILTAMDDTAKLLGLESDHDDPDPRSVTLLSTQGGLALYATAVFGLKVRGQTAELFMTGTRGDAPNWIKLLKHCLRSQGIPAK